ncbi:MAG: apolipoprotein N-acyltransferase [Oxalobacter sp.]|nr:MAG: apolipoprotein N-acyltransferase [Oxalobacter sp.]
MTRLNPRYSVLLDSLIALCVGGLTVFAFAPFGYWPIQLITLAIFFHLVQRHTSVRKSALIGLAFGFGWSLSCVHWLYISMHRYGGLASWMAVVAVMLFSLVLALFPALFAALSIRLQRRWYSPQTVSLLLILPSMWTLCEWLRGWVLTGFPWVASGYAHTASPLAGFAPVIGVFGLGWCAALLAGCLTVSLNRRAQFRFGALIVGMMLLITGTGLTYVQWTTPNGHPISVRLLQGNVPQEMKFSRSKIGEMLKQYQEMIMAQPADLVATPETAIPIFPERLPADYLPQLATFSKSTNTHLLIGIPVLDTPEAYSNSVIGIAPNAPVSGGTPYRYDKHHLVPFGEFVPTGFRWFVNLMHIPLGDFSRGNAVQATFKVKDQNVLPNICYEDLFGEEIADQIAAAQDAKQPEPTILLNLSNIAWFGDSVALPQHLQISQMRSLETGRPMLRSTNTGATAVINHRGKIIAQLTPYTRDTLAASVQGYKGATPYIRWGNILPVAWSMLCLIAAIFLARRFRSTLRWS